MPLSFKAAVAAAALLAPVVGSAAPVAFSLGDDGTSLVFLGDVNLQTPGVAVPIRDSATRAPVALTDIDFEKETGDLYGVSAAQSAVFKIDPQTGVATFRAALPTTTTAPSLFNDWNNAIDRMRIVSSEESDGADLNFVFNQDANTVAQFTNLFYAAGDVNAGVDPLIVGNAYRDAVATGGAMTPPPQGGMQLAIDAATDSLVSFANNAGTLATLATFGFDVTGPGGFDIFSTPDGMGGFDDVGYALLRDVPQGQGGGAGNAIRLVSFSLPDTLSGQIAVTTLRTFGNGQFGGLQGLALIDSGALPAPIPLPAPVALLLAGLAALGFVGRRGVSRA